MMTRTDRRRFPILFAAISTLALPAAVLSAQTDGTGICDRTRQVRGAILDKLNNIDCSAVTVQASDFQGLSGLDADTFGHFLANPRAEARPLWLAPGPTSILAETLKSEVDMNLDFDIEHQNPDGSWSPAWSWYGQYPEAWEQAEQHWKSCLTVEILKALKEFGRIEGLQG